TSFQGRTTAWQVAIAIAREHPVFGGGFNAGQQMSVWNRYVAGIEPSMVNHLKAAHSIFFQVLGDLGYPGLLLFLSIIGATAWNLSAVLKFSRRQPDLAWMNDLAQMFRLTLVVYAVSGALLSMAYFEFFYITVSMVGVLRAFCHRLEAESDAAAVAGGP